MKAGTSRAVVAVTAIPSGWTRSARACDADPPLAGGDLVVLQTDTGAVLAEVSERVPVVSLFQP
ncbi:MAG TPA: hypothetical protein PLT35_02535, partial [Vicinamibacterales bacterium]|nr:hypothetical protein [Vicinamibacterales bacterium]